MKKGDFPFYQLGVVRGQPCLPLGLDLESPSESPSLMPLRKPCCGLFLTGLTQSMSLLPAGRVPQQPELQKATPTQSNLLLSNGKQGQGANKQRFATRPLPTAMWAISPKEAGGGSLGENGPRCQHVSDPHMSASTPQVATSMRHQKKKKKF